MLLIRRFEEKVTERFRAAELPGFLHAAIGLGRTRGRAARPRSDGRKREMSVTVDGVDHSAGTREALLSIYAARDAKHDDAVVLAQIVPRGRRS